MLPKQRILGVRTAENFKILNLVAMCHKSSFASICRNSTTVERWSVAPSFVLTKGSPLSLASITTISNRCEAKHFPKLRSGQILHSRSTIDLRCICFRQSFMKSNQQIDQLATCDTRCRSRHPMASTRYKRSCSSPHQSSTYPASHHHSSNNPLSHNPISISQHSHTIDLQPFIQSTYIQH